MARPRDPHRDAAILEATLSVLVERGFAGLTIEEVAERATVGRPTIYRRWATKADLVLSAVTSLTAVGRGGPAGTPAQAPDTGTLRGDLEAMAERLVKGFAGMERMGIMSGIAAEMATNREFSGRLRAELLDPDQRALAEVFRRAEARGELRAGIDGAEVLEALAGIVFYRQVLLHRPCPPRWRRQIVDLLVDGLPRSSPKF